MVSTGERGILLSYNLDLCTLVFCLRVPEEGPINPIKDVIWAQMRCGGNHGRPYWHCEGVEGWMRQCANGY